MLLSIFIATPTLEGRAALLVVGAVCVGFGLWRWSRRRP